jgi:hypothetical protein
MTKEDFIREVQKLDSRTRKEVVEQSNASQAIKKVAKQDLPPETAVKAAKAAEHHAIGKDKQPAGPSAAPARRPGLTSPPRPSEQTGETAVERKRRLAVLQDQEDEQHMEETGETPAERRRREAALGVGNDGDDSDDEGGERVPPNRRGITFADSTRPGRGRTAK